MVSEKKKPDGGPADEAAVTVTVTTIGAATTQIAMPGGAVIEVQKHPVLGTTQLVYAVPIDTGAADATVKAARAEVERNYRAAAGDLLGEKLGHLNRVAAALDRERKEVVQHRHAADQKRAEAEALLLAGEDDTRKIDKLQVQATEKDWDADRHTANVAKLEAEVKRLRAEADAELRAGNSALVEAATGYDGKGLAKAVGALAAALADVTPVALRVHAVKQAKLNLAGGAADSYLEETLPGAPARTAPRNRAFPTDGPVRVRRVGPPDAS